MAPTELKCRIEGCKRPYRAKGYCGVHYRAWRHKEQPHARYRTCSVDECRKPALLKSLCEEHLRARYPKLAPALPAKEAVLVAAPAPAPDEAPAAP